VEPESANAEPDAQVVTMEILEAMELAPGVTGRPLFGHRLMLNLVEFEPGTVVPEHSHEHEQAGMVLRGELILVLAGEERRLGPMEAFAIPSGMEHSARGGPYGAVVLDVFHPVREDYRERWEALEA
jgi:quercetin dioxygenase-like cupin family protein